MFQYKLFDSVHTTKSRKFITQSYQYTPAHEERCITEESLPTILRKTKQIVLNETSFTNYIHNHYTSPDRSYDTGRTICHKGIKNEESLQLTKRSSNTKADPDVSTGLQLYCKTQPDTFTNFKGYFKKTRNINLKKEPVKIKSNFGVNSYFQDFNNFKYYSTDNENKIKIDFSTVDGLNSSRNLKGSLNNENYNNIPLEKLYDLEYNMKVFDIENEVFKKFWGEKLEGVKQFIINKVKEISKSKNEDAAEFEKNKQYSYCDLKNEFKVSLSLQSICLTLKRKDKTENEDIILKLPFSFIFLFFYTNMQSFKQIISQILKFNLSFDKIELDLEMLPEVLRKFDIIQLDHYKDNSNIFIRNVTLTPIDIVTSLRIYEMNIQMPSIEFTIEDTPLKNKKSQKLTFNKQIEKEMILFVLQESLEKWDAHLLNYLCRSKLYREKLIQFLNKKTKNSFLKLLIKPTDIKINLDSPYLKQHAVRKSNYYEAIIFFPSKNKEFVLSKYTKLYSYKFEVGVEFLINNKFVTKKFEFNLNFDHMMKLEKLRGIESLENFLKRCIIIDRNKQSVCVDIHSIESIDDEYVKFLKLLHIKTKEKEVLADDSITVKVIYPNIHWVGLVKEKIEDESLVRDFSFEMPSELLLNFEVKESEWSLIIKYFLDELIVYNYKSEKKEDLKKSSRKTCIVQEFKTKKSLHKSNTRLVAGGSFKKNPLLKKNTEKEIVIEKTKII